MPDRPVSIVIPVYNGEKTIAAAIDAVARQSYPGAVEIIVVDDGSTDNTPEVVRSHKNVLYIAQKNSGPAAARNTGARAAQGEIIFFTDSDCIPNPDWIEKSVAHFEDPGIAVVAGSYEIANPGVQLARCIQDEIMYRHRRLMPDFPKSFGSYNFCLRKKVFDAVGGFNQDYRFASGEDNDLSYKILKEGHKIFFERGSKVKHFHAVKVVQYLREQFQHGFWRFKMYYDHPQMSAGDDYTFWKDIVEPPLVGLLGLSLMGALAVPSLIPYAAVFLAALACLEIYYATVMATLPGDKPFFVFLTFCRAFARTFGFVFGIFYFLSRKIFLTKHP